MNLQWMNGLAKEFILNFGDYIYVEEATILYRLEKELFK